MKLIHSLFLIVFFYSAGQALAQQKTYTVLNAHAHNDYQNDTPFFKAFDHGFGSIEADVFAVDGELFVAHKKEDIHAERTLKKMYLDPLKQKLKEDKNRKIQLLIDIKEHYAIALPILIGQLKSLKKYYSRLSIVISGNRPPPAEYKNYPHFIYFDDDLMLLHTKKQWKRVGLVSLQFSVFSKWKGIDTIPPMEEERLRKIITSVHDAGKSIRFWDAPDTPMSWQEQMKLRVDYIGTDAIAGFSEFLKKNEIAWRERKSGCVANP